MAKVTLQKIKTNFGTRKGGKHCKAKNKQVKKYKGQGR
jgi:hypothetical protein